MKGQHMSDLGKVMVTLLTRSVVREHFEAGGDAASIGATTHTDSVYLVDIEAGEEPQEFTYEENTYVMRRGSVSINGKRYSDISVGYNFATGTFLVLDNDYRSIRRSSSIARLELLA
jgi:hypothetical protein